MNKLLIATRNNGKIMELKRLLDDFAVEVVTLADIPVLSKVEENGRTFLENATLKAVTAAKESGLITLADDSGLEVDILKGLPGVHSARFAGEPSEDSRNNKKLLELLAGVPPDDRNARFVCVIAIATPDGKVYSAEGRCEGVILEELRGAGGFGYDPLFYVPELQKTFAELNSEEKNFISHRGKALKTAVGIIRGLLK